MKKVFKWGCMFFIVTFGISLALMLFNLPSEEEMAKILVEQELENKEQLENFNKNKEKKWASIDVNVRSSAGVEEGIFSDNKSTVLSENQLVYTINEITNGFEKVYNSSGKEMGWVSSKYLMNKPYSEKKMKMKEIEKNEKIAKENRRKKVENQFSAWDGSHVGLVRYVKNDMNDASSFEHVDTRYRDEGNKLFVVMKFRGKNAFGALILNTISARVDFSGNVLEITAYE